MLPDDGHQHREQSGLSMRGLLSSAHAVAQTISQDIGGAIRRHFGNHLGGTISGLYLRLPFTPLSAFLEWREKSVGFGHDHNQGRLEVFAGRLQGVFCIERSAA